ncbi:MAG: TRAP transporter large permease subunit [Solibacillus sp.]|jgi:TRAP-type transport system large permease protein|uniref:TRAP transporter large permease n=1 Tax=unclassified Solibacillus TaxID=2637870 RepID=UPI0030FC3333
MSVIVFLGVLLGALIIGVPIAFGLLLATIFLMFYIDSYSATIVAQNLMKGAQSFPLIAVPFFILAGEIMNVGGIGKRLVDLGLAIFGHVKGGLGYVVIVASIIFAGLSGSALADAAALGAILLPMMVKGGYDKGQSMGLIASGSLIALLIPPSISLIMYGVIANVSITRLFMAGVFPGFLMAVGLAVTWFILVKRNKEIQVLPKKSTAEVFAAIKGSIWAIFLPVIIIVGLRGGIFTATEAASVAVFYALFVSLVIYREMKLSDIGKVLVNASKTTSVVIFMVAAAMAGAWVITIANVPQQLAELLGPINNQPLLLIAFVMLIVLLLGMIMDTGPIILIIVPVVLPMLVAAGVDPVYFGILLVLNGAIGLITPPVGSVLNVSLSVSKLTMGQLTKGIWPFILTYVLLLILLMLFPELITVPADWLMK